jgi:hypothetical protein
MGKGVKMGPPFKLTEHQRNLAVKAHGQWGEYPPDCARFQRQPQHDRPAAVTSEDRQVIVRTSMADPTPARRDTTGLALSNAGGAAPRHEPPWR